MLGFRLRRRASTCSGIYASRLYFVVRVPCCKKRLHSLSHLLTSYLLLLNHYMYIKVLQIDKQTKTSCLEIVAVMLDLIAGRFIGVEFAELSFWAVVEAMSTRLFCHTLGQALDLDVGGQSFSRRRRRTQSSFIICPLRHRAGTTNRIARPGGFKSQR